MNRGATGRTPGPAERRRLVVIQVLLLSLFATLFLRLWYLQVSTGSEYRTQAAAQSIRDLVIPPDRGLIVDAEGRPLVANRTSWNLTIDRSVFERLSTTRQQRVLHRVAALSGVGAGTLRARLRLCSEPGADRQRCWNGSPVQPVPVAEDVPAQVAVRISEQAEDYPGMLAQPTTVRSYPEPFRINAAGVLGYLSQVTADELDEARRRGDGTLSGGSVVGRAGLEKSYDRWLRGVPGEQRVAVDSRGRAIGRVGETAATPGDTLVTSLDAKVQAVAEKQLRSTIATARKTFDKVTGRNYVADSGAVVVLDARNGRVIAMAGEPTYDPSIWSGGITEKQLQRLYSAKAGAPLVFRATQGQFAPGSTWKPIMTVGALNHGYRPDTRLNCSSGLQVGNRWFRNYESASYGMIDFARALELSCDTFFYRVGLNYWDRFGSDPADVTAKDPLAAEAKSFGFGSTTGVDLPGEAAGRVADRRWKRDYWRATKDHYCAIDRRNTTGKRDFLHVYAHEFCLEGNLYRAGDAVNFAIGQGDTLVTPLQLARAYAALANGGTLYHPQIAKAIIDPTGTVVKRFGPRVEGRVASSRAALRYVDTALQGTLRQGTLAWRFHGFPLDRIPIRGKTGSAEVYGKQSTSWVATYTRDYVVVMMVTQGGTGSGTSGPAVRAIWEALYGVVGDTVEPRRALIPGVTPPKALPVFAPDGSILPPRRGPGR